MLSRPVLRAGAFAALLLSGAALSAFPEPGIAHEGDHDPPTRVEKRRGRGARLRRVGFLRLPGPTADVWGHEGFAYVGSAGHDEALGVRIVDLSRPRRPRLVGRVAEITGTTQEDVMVATINTPSFQGDLLATGIQHKREDPEAPRGLDLWDVTDPRSPQHLAFLPSGPFTADAAPGVHELTIFQRGDRAFVIGMVPASEEMQGQGDVRIIEVTDPRNPVQIADWGALKDGGIPLDDPYPWGHSPTVNSERTRAYISFWDAGVVVLDISDPGSPAMVAHLTSLSGPDGNTHSTALAHNETVLLVNDENLSPLSQPTPWGYMRLFDITSLGNPVKLGEFKTPHATQTRPTRNGIYSIHNTVVSGNLAYSSWYSDGVRVTDISDPANPREVAAYVPPRPLVWGVALEGDLVLASNILSGLYVLRLRQ